MSSNPNEIHFLISYAVALVVCGLIAKWYLWPAVRDRDPRTALTPLLLYGCLRVNGLMFLMPGLVSPALPQSFARPTAYGDLIAALLALLAVAALRYELGAKILAVWVFNVEGFLDLVYANISTFKDHVDPVSLGVSYYLAAVNVPAMLAVHILIFAYLFGLQHPARPGQAGRRVGGPLSQGRQ